MQQRRRRGGSPRPPEERRCVAGGRAAAAMQPVQTPPQLLQAVDGGSKARAARAVGQVSVELVCVIFLLFVSTSFQRLCAYSARVATRATHLRPARDGIEGRVLPFGRRHWRWFSRSVRSEAAEGGGVCGRACRRGARPHRRPSLPGTHPIRLMSSRVTNCVDAPHARRDAGEDGARPTQPPHVGPCTLFGCDGAATPPHPSAPFLSRPPKQVHGMAPWPIEAGPEFVHGSTSKFTEVVKGGRLWPRQQQQQQQQTLQQPCCQPAGPPGLVHWGAAATSPA